MSHAFNKLHEQISIVRAHVEALDDPEATEYLEAMEYGLFAPMRKLRVHLDVPYLWPEKKRGERKEVAA
jgi:hypothetical protein